MSQLFTKTRKEAPRDESSKNAALLIRAGFIEKLSAGVYTYLPLGLLVLSRIQGIIRDEMNAIGGQELLMPSLHPKENWVKTGRWEMMDDLYTMKDASGKEFALGPTHEEVIVPLAKQFIASYRDLPQALYQFQNKFRMELRAKAGLLRGREFLMKDLYSFHRDGRDFEAYYEKVKEAYGRIFEKSGIGAKTYLTYASGGTFSKYSHEFQMITPAGEDVIYFCASCKIAINREIIETQTKCPQCGKEKKGLKEERAIEVGNIFPLKTKFSDAFGLTYKNEEGKENPVVMGCYGIGLGRLMGAIVEALADAKGLSWPQSVAPFDAHLMTLGHDEKVSDRAESLYRMLEERGISVLYDDRRQSAGVKFEDAELIGIPYALIVSEKTIAKGNVIEMERRDNGETRDVNDEEMFHILL